MPSLAPETRSAALHAYVSTLGTWNAAADRIERLARYQMEILDTSPHGGLPETFLAEKSGAYIDAAELADQASRERDLAVASDRSRSGLLWEEANRREIAVHETLKRTEAIEAEARSHVQSRLTGVRAEMERLARRRTVAGSYAGMSGPAGGPRFLDQRR